MADDDRDVKTDSKGEESCVVEVLVVSEPDGTVIEDPNKELCDWLAIEDDKGN